MADLPFTPIIAADGWLVASGQVGVDNGTLVDGGVGPQLTQAIANLEQLLHQHEADLTAVVKTTVFLTSMDDYAEMNTAYAQAFGAHRPARSAVAVLALPIGASVEIEAWAYVR